MGVSMSGTMTGAAHGVVVHGPSGVELRVAAPQDNGGDGSTFSPTDLCAVSLGACAAMTMSLYAGRNGIDARITFDVTKEMSASPRRIGRLTVKITVAGPVTDEQFEKLKAAAHTCPVRRSLHPDVVIDETFVRAG